MIGRLHVKAAVLATLALAAPLANPASAQVVPGGVALVECSSGGLQVPALVNPIVHLSKEVELNVQGLECLDILQLLIDEGFSAHVDPTGLGGELGQNQGLGTAPAPEPLRPLPSPGIAVVGLGTVKLFWQFYRGPTEGSPLPEGPD